MLSNRARYNVDVFMPSISAKVKQKTSAASEQKIIDLATAENWLMRDELVGIFKDSISRELGSAVCLSPASSVLVFFLTGANRW